MWCTTYFEICVQRMAGSGWAACPLSHVLVRAPSAAAAFPLTLRVQNGCHLPRVSVLGSVDSESPEPASAGTCHLCGCDRKEHKYQCHPSTDLIATLVCTLEIQAKPQICVCGLLTSLQMSNATRVMCPETMSQHRHCHLASWLLTPTEGLVCYQSIT